jgi:hypothetical protein
LVKGNKFHFWNDNGFHIRNFEKNGLKELIGAWGNVIKNKPVRPVRTTCFLVDLDLIAEHPDHYEKNCNVHTQWKDVFNTAEEALAYSYNSARNTGIPAGFVTSLDDLKYLSPDMTDLLVLPPLNRKIKKEHIASIRQLHQKGVSLLGFENVHGLEDLFGVKPLEKAMKVQKIGVVPEYTVNVGILDDEFTEHELCKACYENQGASVVLSGTEQADGAMDIPVLLTNKTKWGITAFFNVPPTVVKRDSFIERIGFGQECVSTIIREASKFIIKKLSTPCVCVLGANPIAFYDEKGEIAIVVEEKSPEYSDTNRYPRAFLLNINLPDIKSGNISCDKDYSVACEKPGNIVLRLFLEKYGTALFKLKLNRTGNIPKK